MAKSVNRVFLLGNVGKDPEVRSTGAEPWWRTLRWPRATAFRMRRATGRTAPSGTTWWRSSALAEIVRDYVKKGSKLFVEGRVRREAGMTKRPAPSDIARKLLSTTFRSCQGATTHRAAEGTAVRRMRRVRPAIRIWTSARRRARMSTRNRPRFPTTTFRSKTSKGTRNQGEGTKSGSRHRRANSGSRIALLRAADSAAKENPDEKALVLSDICLLPRAAGAGDAA